MTHSDHTGQLSLIRDDPSIHIDQFAACAQTTLTTLNRSSGPARPSLLEAES